MKTTRIKNFQIDDLIKMALKEDINYEDISTNAIYKEDRIAKVDLISKDSGILAGLDVFKRVFELLDGEVKFIEYKSDGDSVKPKDLVMEVKGNISTLLSGERLALNFLQRMSGIATYAAKMIRELDDDKISIMDTRKTTPNMRIFEKYAVKIGGANNHRYNLSDGILLKDNHIEAAGSVKNAVKMAREYSRYVKKIEVEVETIDMVKEALEAGADIIMLDNMSIEQIKESSAIINKRAIIECSGNITLENIKNYKGLNIDYLSSGSMIYNANVLDLSMKNLRYSDEWNRREKKKNNRNSK